MSISFYIIYLHASSISNVSSPNLLRTISKGISLDYAPPIQRLRYSLPTPSLHPQKFIDVYFETFGNLHQVLQVGLCTIGTPFGNRSLVNAYLLG